MFACLQAFLFCILHNKVLLYLLMKLLLSVLVLAGYCCKSNKQIPAIDSNGIVYFSADNGGNWMNKSKGLPDSISLTDVAVSGALLGVTTKQHGIFLFDLPNEVWVKTVATPLTSSNLVPWEKQYMHLLITNYSLQMIREIAGTVRKWECQTGNILFS